MLGSILLCACREETGPRAAPAVDPYYAGLVELLDPLGDAEDPAASEAVLVVDGVPIRRGDFAKVEPLLRERASPDIARQPLLEAALLNTLLPRAIALSELSRPYLDEVSDAVRAWRKERSSRPLMETQARFDALSEEPIDTAVVTAITPQEILRIDPRRAAALVELRGEGDRANPFFSRYGWFLLEQVQPLPARADLSTPRHVRHGGLRWRFEGEGSEGFERRLPEAVRRRINEREVIVLDEEYRLALPERLP